MKSTDSVVDTNLRTKIYQTIQHILIQEFVSGPKTTIKDMRARLTFACPYCGDSTNDLKKKRGNFFWNSLQYHCYNAGCKAHKSLNSLLKDFHCSNNFSSEERINIMDYVASNTRTVTTYSLHEFRYFSLLNELAIPLEQFYQVTESQPIFKGGPGWNILTDRLLTHKKLEFAYKWNRLLILNLTADRKKVIGYQIRLLNSKGPNKYLSFSLEKLRKQCGLETQVDEGDVLLHNLNQLSTIFGILTVDFTQDVTVFEGPIDAKFMRNSLGMATVERDTGLFNDLPTVRYFYDNDNAGLTEMRSLLSQGKRVFLWKKFLKDHGLERHMLPGQKAIKDLNDIIKICYYNNHDAYKYINQYFSNESLDAFYL